MLGFGSALNNAARGPSKCGDIQGVIRVPTKDEIELVVANSRT